MESTPLERADNRMYGFGKVTVCVVKTEIKNKTNGS